MSLPLRVTFDPQIFVVQQYGGISRYFVSLAKELLMQQDLEAKLFIPLHLNTYLSQLSKEVSTGYRLPAVPKSRRVIGIVTSMLWTRWVLSYKPHLIHETYYSSCPYGPVSIPRIITVYDMIHELYPNYFPNAEAVTTAKKKSIERAHHVICISKQTQLDLIDIFRIDPAKTSVIHLGFDRLSINGTDGGVVAPPKQPYVLYVGARAGYKNFGTFVRAFARSRLMADGFAITCFGGGSFNPSERELLRSNGLSPNRVMQINGNDDSLAGAYQKAALFVYPSLYEGFGIPPLEAMSLGCPVASSNTAAVSEVVGESAELFDPLSEDSISQAMERIVYSRPRREKLIALGRDHCRKFSWKNCAASTMSLYKALD